MKKIIFSSIAATCLLNACVSVPKTAVVEQTTYRFSLDEPCPSDLNLTVGQTISMKVYDNVSTGYTWKIGELQHMNVSKATAAKPFVKEGLVGAGEDVTYIFRAESVGQDTIQMYHSRSWEPATPARWSCKVKIS